MTDTIAYEPRGEQQNQYPLTLKHVKQFLATKEDNDPLGFCFCALDCLLSETLDWLYPEQKSWRVDLCSYSTQYDTSEERLDPECYFLRCVFDRCGTIGKTEVTKARLRAYLESIVIDKEGRIGGRDIPFDVDDLFGE